MSNARARKSAAAAADATALSESHHQLTNGNVAMPTEKENIFLFMPNLIGYARIVLAVVSLWYMPLHPRTCSGLYSVSCLLDALDGYAARYLDQSTSFGACLDMVIDRCATTCLLVFLSSAFPRWILVFQALIALDLASHYIHMYATLSTDGANASHKNVSKSQSRILNMYYTDKTVLFTVCALNELFFIALYLLSFSSPFLSPNLLQQVPSVAAGSEATPKLIQQVYNNPYSAGALELARANKMDSTVPWILAGISAPVMALKQFINVVQLVKASQRLAEMDRKARNAKGLPKKNSPAKQ
ncbi:CDP-diacylglycerol--inositol 3-phosphatidyltransferase [Coniochaeta hoffmannii]|uniref:CDP-diacylglycerol--inositol 3-phosphatidyltransferase n=1 Tax=Coniochaeta hoffmannii TaxID=91930 RepID=A0AA38VMG9_9PEZI|nr:CDP-diacylglycerol--inositol 3-phosphatidyltransferase [Coniochaeta hoffmannii]